jgi:hypothetical protein
VGIQLQGAIASPDLALLCNTAGAGRNGISGPKLMVRWFDVIKGSDIGKCPGHRIWPKRFSLEARINRLVGRDFRECSYRARASFAEKKDHTPHTICTCAVKA